METQTERSTASYQAYQILRWGFVVLPILAGIDKFSHFLWGEHLLGDWHMYLADVFPNALGVEGHTIMYIVGAVEILAGIVVDFAPQFGGYLVMLWLWAIIINLLVLGEFYDIALRDFGLSLAALALARLAMTFHRR